MGQPLATISVYAHWACLARMPFKTCVLLAWQSVIYSFRRGHMLMTLLSAVYLPLQRDMSQALSLVKAFCREQGLKIHGEWPEGPTIAIYHLCELRLF